MFWLGPRYWDVFDFKILPEMSLEPNNKAGNRFQFEYWIFGIYAVARDVM